jgi:hypothetical protein
MSIARLRAILQSSFQVRLESTPEVIQRLNSLVLQREKTFTDRGQTAPLSKSASVVDSVGSRNWNVRPIDLLHKIGKLTTPSNVNMAQLSASWATRRYFWAIAEGQGSPGRFRLSQDARDLDFHQKTLLSDEFGVGFAGLLLEDEFDAGLFADISVALGDPSIYQQIGRKGGPQPDYLMWGANPNSPYYVVECKGSQTNKATSFDQLRRGLEQVPSIVFGSGPRQVMTLVVATCMEKGGATMFVVDPPPDESNGESRTGDSSEKVSERTGKWSWRIPNPERFAERAWKTQESSLLKWAGQYGEAAKRDSELEPWRWGLRDIPQDSPRIKVGTEFGEFVGTRKIAFPELGQTDIRIFTGIEEQLFADITERRPRAQETALASDLRFRKGREEMQHDSPFRSISSNGTYMLIEGL